jgi:hypothetical protein
VDIGDTLRPDVFYFHGGIAGIFHSLSPGFLVNAGSEKCFYGCQVEAILIAQDPGLPLSWGRGQIGLEAVHTYLEKFDTNPYLTLPFTAGNNIFTESEMRNYRTHFSKLHHKDEIYEG